MKFSILIILAFILVGCSLETSSDPEPRFDVTLAPTQIAANQYQPPVYTEIARVASGLFETSPTIPVSETSTQITVPTITQTPTDEPAPDSTSTPTATATSTIAAEFTETPSEIVDTPAPLFATPSPAPLPTSNNAELRLLQNSQTLGVSLDMLENCFLEGDFIPFRLVARSITSEPFFFYKKGQWQLSINNSPLGPELAPVEPSARDEFEELAPNEFYIQDEEDLGLWVLSLGPDSGIPFSSTGIGLPVGEYWITFLYKNGQDGLTEQRDGTYLIPKAAWQGTAVSSEVRLKIVDDLSKCEEG